MYAMLCYAVLYFPLAAGVFSYAAAQRDMFRSRGADGAAATEAVAAAGGEAAAAAEELPAADA